MVSTQAVQLRTGSRQIGIALLVGYLLVYAGMLFAMRRSNFDVNESLLVFIFLGVGFSLAAWLLTIGVHPLTYTILEPRSELEIIGAYLVSVVVVVT